MSTARFLKEHGDAMRLGDETDHHQRMQEAYHVVRDSWLAKKDYMALVKAIVGNWTSGNCVEYMLPVSAALIAEGEVELHRYLWTNTVKRQVNAFFREYSFVRSQRLTFQDIHSTDSSGFDEFNSDYGDHRLAAAFLLKRIVSSLLHWTAELTGSGLDTRDPDLIEQSLNALKRPHIEVNSLLSKI